MRVALNDIDERACRQATQSLRAEGFDVTACPGDVSKRADVDRIFSGLDPLWLLVNNAGAFHSAPTEEFTEEAWDHAFAIDVKAVFLCSQAFIRQRPRDADGRIVVVSSIAGAIVRTGQIAYCSAKAAAIHYTRCLAVEVAPRGITVNCICPGMTDSGMLRQTADARGLDVREYVRMIPSGRLAKPEDHADTIEWLASDEAAHVTGILPKLPIFLTKPAL